MYHQLLILVTFIFLPNSTAIPHLLLGAAVHLTVRVYGAHSYILCYVVVLSGIYCHVYVLGI